MALVDYSDSEGSDTGDTQPVKVAPKVSKGTFHKVVDRSNPGKIRVSFPESTPRDGANENDHPAKRIKTGAGGLSGFNSFLPPPKRTGQTSNGSLGNGNTMDKKGLGPGIILRTGAAPGFSREPEESESCSGLASAQYDGEDMAESASGGLSLPPPNNSHPPDQKPAEEVQLIGKPLMFKPLSVARNPAKKKKKPPGANVSGSAVGERQLQTSKPEALAPPPSKPKVSLFTVSKDDDEPIVSTSNGAYEPMVFGASMPVDDDEVDREPLPEDDVRAPDYSHSSSHASIVAPQSLDDIASDLNLSAADRRQLFGRQRGSKNGVAPSATRVINFNTDEEYRHNEELRAAGEEIVHNPVRAIAPGKHSLKQLINAAASQKEALEESFAKGKSNRAEASSRYGW